MDEEDEGFPLMALCYRADGLLATYQSGERIDPRGWREDWKAARVGLG